MRFVRAMTEQGAILLRWIAMCALLAIVLPASAGIAGTWSSTGPYGDAYALLIDGSGTVYAGTLNGVFKSTDGGGSWAAINSGLVDAANDALTVNALAQGAGGIYAGTAKGVYKTTNGGASWTAMNTGLFGASVEIQTILIDGTANIYIGTLGGGLYKSTDGANTWTAVNTGFFGSAKYVNALAMDKAGIIYAGMGEPAGAVGGGIYKSADGGTSWTAAIDGNLSGNTYVNTLVTDSAGNVYAGTYSGGVYKSTDGGNTWETANGNVAAGYVSALVVDAHGNVYAGTPAGVYQSADGGNSWTLLTGMTVSLALAVDASGNVYSAVSNRGWAVYKYAPASTQPANFSVVGIASGPDSALLLNVDIVADAAVTGQKGNLYVAAFLPAPSNQIFLLTPGGWTLYNGMTVTPVMSNVVLGSNAVTILKGTLNVSGLAGVTLYAGYGLNQADLLNKQKYMQFYTIH